MREYSYLFFIGVHSIPTIVNIWFLYFLWTQVFSRFALYFITILARLIAVRHQICSNTFNYFSFKHVIIYVAYFCLGKMLLYWSVDQYNNNMQKCWLVVNYPLRGNITKLSIYKQLWIFVFWEPNSNWSVLIEMFVNIFFQMFAFVRTSFFGFAYALFQTSQIQENEEAQKVLAEIKFRRQKNFPAAEWLQKRIRRLIPSVGGWTS